MIEGVEKKDEETEYQNKLLLQLDIFFVNKK
jgi:hypothetical protein